MEEYRVTIIRRETAGPLHESFIVKVTDSRDLWPVIAAELPDWDQIKIERIKQ